VSRTRSCNKSSVVAALEISRMLTSIAIFGRCCAKGFGESLEIMAKSLVPSKA
jgi:hypothetical protein